MIEIRCTEFDISDNMKNKYRILKILVTVIILGFLLSFSLRRFSNQKIDDSKVSVKLNDIGTKVYFIDEKDIRGIVKKYNPTGRIGDIQIPELEKKINDFPAVDSANVYLNLNGNLNLDIKQRVPVFRLSKNRKDFYVDEKGVEFPISKNYSHTCMLVTGDIKQPEYVKIAELVKKINKDDFCKKYFVGIAKEKNNYNLLTSEGNFKVEIGNLENINFKVKGFKTFVEKFLIYQNPQKYNKISVKYNNQIVTTLNPYFKENDSVLKEGKKEIEKIPEALKKEEEVVKKTEPDKSKKSNIKTEESKVKTEKPSKKTVKKETKNKSSEKHEKKATQTEKKHKAKIEIE